MTARLLCLGAAVIAALLLGPSDARAQVPDYDTCDAEVAEVLWDAKLDTARVRSTYISPRLDIGRSKTFVVGIQVWVRLADCKGAMVLDFTPACRLEQAYTRGECKVEGVKKF